LIFLRIEVTAALTLFANSDGKPGALQVPNALK